MRTAELSRQDTNVLLVDDEPNVTRGIQLALRKEPFKIECADSGREALELLSTKPFDVIVSDERMPGMPGSELLSIVRERHPDVVRIILSGQASLDAALRAINNAEIYRFLIKPCAPEEIGLSIREALSARASRRQFEAWTKTNGDTSTQLREAFEEALGGIWMGFQPIVSARDGAVYAYEALMRNSQSNWGGPGLFLAMAQRLERTEEVGRRIRSLVAQSIPLAPQSAKLFVNANPADLDDVTLVEGLDDLGAHAHRIVLEITERESLESLANLNTNIARLRGLGYRIALDDLGAGYAGLTSLALVSPDVVKFDMDLVRNIDASPTKQKLVGTMVQMCHEMGIQTLAEGIETTCERDVVVRLNCDLLQGYLFGKADREFRAPAQA